jgi:heme A synthase
MLHATAFRATVLWTLGLLFLGSVVHATESSLACPDWPTCFGTMMPEMTGGVFWEHLHRLVAGGLLLLFGLATWLARRETRDQPWIFQACLAGLGLLVVQSVFGGLTVIYRLPDMISTSHLSMAFLFLALATVLAAATGGPTSPTDDDFGPGAGPRLLRIAAGAAVLVFAQSVLGALVRHTDGGMSCPDVPLCLGQVVPPLVNVQITSHVLHRGLAIVATLAVLGVAWWVRTHEVPARVRRWAYLAAFLVLLQVGLGVASVLTVLAVAPVSLHTLVAAALLSSLVAVATLAARAEAPSLVKRTHATV